MQESEHKYKWYYSPKCTFKNEKKADREKTMVSVLTRAKKCAKISFVFEKDAGVAQSVEQLIRNQQVRCSSHPTSSRHRTLFECGAFLYSNRITLKGRSVTGRSGLFSFCGRNRRMKYRADRRLSPLLAKQVRGCGGCKQTRPDPNGSSRLIGGQTGRYQLNCFLISAFTLSRSLQVKIGISRLISSMLLSHHLNLSSNSISSSSKRF